MAKGQDKKKRKEKAQEEEIIMAHPFYKILNKELSRSSLEENFVLKKAEEIKESGYRPEEIYEVLVRLSTGLIDDDDSKIVEEAVEEFSRYIDLE